VHHLATIDNVAHGRRTLVPLQVLADIDNARNPMQLTRERLERTATENQFMNGKIAALDVSTRSSFDDLVLMPWSASHHYDSRIDNTWTKDLC
jgi:mediator of RNA polymerase II transcription subunit 10